MCTQHYTRLFCGHEVNVAFAQNNSFCGFCHSYVIYLSACVNKWSPLLLETSMRNALSNKTFFFNVSDVSGTKTKRTDFYFFVFFFLPFPMYGTFGPSCTLRPHTHTHTKMPHVMSEYCTLI